MNPGKEKDSARKTVPSSVLILPLLPLVDSCGSAVDEAKAGFREVWGELGKAVAGYGQIDISSTLEGLESTQSAAEESWNTLQASVGTRGEEGDHTCRLEAYNVAGESVAEDQLVEVLPAAALFDQ
jgi:hypothetical protein